MAVVIGNKMRRNIVFTPLLIALALCLTVNAASPTHYLSSDQYAEHGFTVTCVKDNSDASLTWVYVSAPLKKWEDIKLSSIGFRIVEDVKTIIGSNIQFQELKTGHATGRFLIRKDLRKNTTIAIVYGVESRSSYILTIPRERGKANK
jgi:hypothetical protein